MRRSIIVGAVVTASVLVFGLLGQPSATAIPARSLPAAGLPTRPDPSTFGTTTCYSPGPGPDLGTADTLVAGVINLTGSGSGFQGKVMMTDGAHAASFGIQYDTAAIGGGAFSNQPAFLSENVSPGDGYFAYQDWCIGKLGTDIPVMMAYFATDHTLAFYVAGTYIGSQFTYLTGAAQRGVEANVKHNGDSVNLTMSSIVIGSGGFLWSPPGVAAVQTPQGFQISKTSPSTQYYTTVNISGTASSFGPGQDWDSNTTAGAAVAFMQGYPTGNASLPMLRFTETPDMTVDRMGEVLAVDTKGTLWMYPGTQTGSFGNLVFQMGTGFTNLDVFGPGDIDGDRIADVLAIDKATGTLYLYSGNGSLPLNGRRQVGNGWTGWRLIPAGDLTGDGKPDLLGLDSLGDLYMYAGKGNGLFAMKVKVGNGWNGWQLYAAGDLNGDGRNDILGIDSDGNLFQYAGRGNGTFRMKVQAGNGWIGYTLAAGADLNGDGLADIIGRDDTSHALYFYRGLGNARFKMKVQIAWGW